MDSKPGHQRACHQPCSSPSGTR